MENQKFFVSYWLNPSRQQDGKSKLYIRIAIDGRRAEIATTYFIKRSDWDSTRFQVKPKAPHSVLINGFIDHTTSLIKKHFLSYAAYGKNISAKELKDLFLGKEEKVEPKSLKDAFEYHKVKMEDMIRVGKVAKTTLAKYNYCQGKVESFLQFRFKKTDILLSELSMNAQDHIHYYLIEEAKNTLINTDNSVGEIAYSLGFEYPQYFSKLFKQKTGLTPIEYRNMN